MRETKGIKRGNRNERTCRVVVVGYVLYSGGVEGKQDVEAAVVKRVPIDVWGPPTVNGKERLHILGFKFFFFRV